MLPIDGERFFNPHGQRAAAQRRRSNGCARGSGRRGRRACRSTRIPCRRPRWRRARAAVTFIGHSTFLIRTATMVTITDPVFTARAGLLGRIGSRRTYIQPADSSRRRYRRWISSWSAITTTTTWTRGAAAPADRPATSRRWGSASGCRRRTRGAVRELDWWESSREQSADAGRSPACRRTLVLRNRLGMARNTTLWCGWLLEQRRKRRYLLRRRQRAGSTASPEIGTPLSGHRRRVSAGRLLRAALFMGRAHGPGRRPCCAPSSSAPA